MSDIGLSVVIPIYNEEEVLPHLYGRLVKSLDGIGLPYEIIFVDDGSGDSSWAVLAQINRDNPRAKAISFSRNFGHQVAITAGVNSSRGDRVMIIDGDLQDPPEIISRFIEKSKEGFEVVYGVRTKRKEGIVKKSMYSIYYRLLSKVSNIDMPLDSGDCCLMDRKVVDLLKAMPERNRFIRGLRAWVGFKQIGLAYERDARFRGKTKYSFFKLWKLALDGILSFSDYPLKMSILFGFIISLLSVAYSLFIVYKRIFQTGNPLPGWASIVAGITFLGGMQLMVAGFMGEYIIRIFDEVKKRPQYIVRHSLGLDERNARSLIDHSGA
jgi:dolichol-phosphate mannosyltransferase